MLKNDTDNKLYSYAVTAANKNYEFWQRDSLAVHLHTKEVAYQKLDYTHYNPCTERWKLVSDSCCYIYSSAEFYMQGQKTVVVFKKFTG